MQIVKKAVSAGLLLILAIGFIAVFAGGILILKIPIIGPYIVYALLAVDIIIFIKWKAFVRWTDNNETVLKSRRFFAGYFNFIKSTDEKAGKK
ncbi:MAG: hypothetical protein ACYCTD_04910 [bacterium]